MNAAELDKMRPRLHEALNEGMVGRVIDELIQANYAIPTDEVDEVKYSYGSLLDFYQTGVDDPKTKDILTNIIERLHSLIDDAYDIEGLQIRKNDLRFKSLEEFLNTELSVYAENYRICCDIESLLNLEQQDAVETDQLSEAYRALFHHIWSQRPDADSVATVENLLLSADGARVDDKKLLISAVLLSLLHRFSAPYLSVLLSLCGDSDVSIRARAMVAVTFVLVVHNGRCTHYPQLMAKIESLMDDMPTRKCMVMAMMQVLCGGQSLAIKDRVMNDITPRLTARIDDMTRNGKDPIEHSIIELTDDDEDFAKTMRQLDKWRMQGADIFYATFSNLKSFSFFNEISNWLLPFSKHNKAIQKAVSNMPESIREQFVDKVVATKTLCESDKYSVILCMSYIPSNHIDMVCESYLRELEVETELNQEMQGLDESVRIAEEAARYVHDLFRLFTLHPKKEEFMNPFLRLSEFVYSDMYRNILVDNEKLLVADCCVQHDMWQLGQTIYEDLASRNVNDVDLNKKLVFCLIKNRQYKRAITELKRIETLGNTSLWTKKRLAVCYHKTGDIRNEIECLLEISKMRPDDINMLINIAKAYEELQKYDEALRYLFELEYKQPCDEAKCMIARCCFLLGRLEQAISYTQKVAEPTVETLMIEGGVHFACGRRAEAMKAFLSAGIKSNTAAHFNDIFEELLDKMRSMGMTNEDSVLILEMVRKIKKEENE